MTLATDLHWRLPDWVEDYIDLNGQEASLLDSIEARMRFVLGLAERNILEATGGPFAAAIFEGSRLISVGVNRVTTESNSTLHAEMTAISLAQTACNTHDLATVGDLELVTSTEPCAMCLGAIPWSGVRHVICGAAGHHAEAAGFDEGLKPDPWSQALSDRGIRLTTGVEAERAAAVFTLYAQHGGMIY